MAYMYKPPLITAELTNPTGEKAYNGFSYAFDVFDNHESYNDLVTWCTDRYGEPGDSETASWHIEMMSMRTVTIWFRDLAQAMEFKFRWV
jgi:hypothetical protein